MGEWRRRSGLDGGLTTIEPWPGQFAADRRCSVPRLRLQCGLRRTCPDLRPTPEGQAVADRIPSVRETTAHWTRLEATRACSSSARRRRDVIEGPAALRALVAECGMSAWLAERDVRGVTGQGQAVRMTGELADAWYPFLLPRSGLKDGIGLLEEGRSRGSAGRPLPDIRTGVPVAVS